MFFSGVVSLRRLRAIFALELTELRLCFYTKNERRNFHSACSAALFHIRDFHASVSSPLKSPSSSSWSVIVQSTYAQAVVTVITQLRNLTSRRGRSAYLEDAGSDTEIFK
jgi:hypothetical protein